MFRPAWSKSHLGRSCAAAGASAAIHLLATNSKSVCEEVPPRISNGEGNGNEPLRVLIVGSGLTGSLTALRIRQRLEKDRSSGPQDARRLDVDLSVVERATYPAGRFGASAAYRGCSADIGAQVLSAIDTKDYRARGGHGVTVEDIRTSNEIVQALNADGVITRADDERLGETEERMLWEGLWEHYVAPKGMSGVLRKLLSWADVEPQFGVRVDSLTVRPDRTIRVTGRHRTKSSVADGSCSDNTLFDERYDCVVLCVPSPDVLRLGVIKYLPPASRRVLENVRYDRRTCEAHFFSAELAPSLAKVFGDKIELMVDGEGDGAIQYISWQNRKRANPAPEDVRTCALVVHGQAGGLQPLGEALDSALSGHLGVPVEEVSSHRLHSKSIPWNVSQMIMPMEAVVADPPTPAWQCIVGDEGGAEGIIIAGDFMTQSSFVGCVASADAAARAVVERVRYNDSSSKNA